MSLKVDFRFLDKDGKPLYYVKIGGANYTDDLQSLNLLHRMLKEHMSCHMTMHGNAVKYAVPDTVKSYMFDTDTFELLPNRFER
jgi:hypothetical protein